MPKSDDVKLFVIDNASTDTTQAYLKEFKDDITVIRIEKNRGFTNGYKDGLSQIKADLYCLLSSDIEVSEGWVEPVLNLFDEQPNVAVIQPKIKSWQKKSDFEYAGAAGGFIIKVIRFVAEEYFTRPKKTKVNMILMKRYFGPQALVFSSEQNFTILAVVLTMIFLHIWRKSTCVGGLKI
jgi:GT2 family glycosyltransferase